MIPYGRQDISDADIEAVVSVLKSDYLTQGPVVPRFEQAIKERVNADHGVAMNSATSALHIACLALELGSNDWLWTTPNTFVASANCARYCGANVDFVDIEPDTGCMDVAALASKLDSAKRAGRVPKVVVPVHFSGQATDQEAIWTLAQKYGFKVVEDASHAVGASHAGEPVGNCRWSHITVFSFHPVKIITSAEGGMAMTNDAELAARMSLLRSHGITRDPRQMRNPPAGSWYYEQLMLGYNYRMTELQAALGLSQLRRLDEFLDARNALARRYDELFAHMPLRTLRVKEGNRSAFHLYVIRLSGATEQARGEVFEALKARGIGVNLHYMPVHLQPYYRAFGFAPGDFPEAETYAREALTLPLFPKLSHADQERIVAEIDKLLTEKIR